MAKIEDQVFEILEEAPKVFNKYCDENDPKNYRDRSLLEEFKLKTETVLDQLLKLDKNYPDKKVMIENLLHYQDLIAETLHTLPTLKR